MAIDPAVIEEIKYRNPIEDVISGYVALKRAGSNLVGLCPFHSEKSPSFTVFVGNGSFYCFGCGAGGNVISFIYRILAEPITKAPFTVYAASGCTRVCCA